MDDKEIMIESLQSTIKRMRKAHENDQSALAAYRIETMDLGMKLSALRNTLRSQGKKPVFIIENPELCGGFLFLEAFLEHENQSVPLKNSDHPTRDSVTLPALFRAEKFGISATAPGYDPTGEGSAYQPAAEGDSQVCAELRAIAQRETERAESATVRAELAERQLAELRSKLRTMGGEG